jgi:hypothetical protein
VAYPSDPDEGLRPVDAPGPVGPVSDTTTGTSAYPTGTTGGSSGGVQDRAAEVGRTTAAAASDVKETAKDQATQVAGEAKQRAADLAGQLRNELSTQSSQQAQRAASGLRSLAGELRGMADRSEQDGPATNLVRQLSDRAHRFAEYLERNGPEGVLDELRNFGRRRPGVFLGAAAAASVAAGRLTRGITAGSGGGGGSTPSGGTWSAATTGTSRPFVSSTPDTTYGTESYRTGSYGTESYGTESYGTATGEPLSGVQSGEGLRGEGYEEPLSEEYQPPLAGTPPLNPGATSGGPRGARLEEG